MDGRNRADIKAGITVEVVEKHNQRTGKVTKGLVEDILTKSSTHPHGIKVQLGNGIVGRVRNIIADNCVN
ncbi:MAG: YwbE family protein [Proteobacteria bacterium]|nr:YwbE family protein [Pseudomonadota bacterium]